jgi:hypothetical protein
MEPGSDSFSNLVATAALHLDCSAAGGLAVGVVKIQEGEKTVRELKSVTTKPMK